MKNTLNVAILLAANSLIMAGDNIAPLTDMTHRSEAFTLIKEINGYIRAGYQNTDIRGGSNYTDMSLGGKLHLETTTWNGINAGASLYTTNVLFGKNEGEGVPFFDADNDSYSILGEAYMMGTWGNSLLKIGRQEIDTPFLDTDDIGMIPNTYEAAFFVNKDITDTTITLAYIEKMAGVDAEPDPAKFDDIRDNDYVQMIGVDYEVTEAIAISGWYYNLKGSAIDNLIYTDATYTDRFESITYEAGVQYAHRHLNDSAAKHANIYGAMVDVYFENSGMRIGAAYNTAQDNYATNGFGGGPFYTSTEHLTLREAGADGDALLFTAGWNADTIGIEGVEFGLAYLTLKDQDSKEATELDLTASYSINDALAIDLFYSDIEDEISGDTLTNLRVFMNYKF